MRALWALGFGLWATIAIAQDPEPKAQSSLRVYLVTIGQGAVYWEKFGHNMLWFADPAAGIDRAFNWGSFDFAAPDFLQRQLVGDPRYWVDTLPSAAIFDYYRRMDRPITIQELNLTPGQARDALDRAMWSIRPENRFYRYDYFRDNCSTRVRDVIDLAFGGGLKATTQDTVPRSYRSETLRLVDDLKITQMGIDLALARPADRLLTSWEGMFIPMRMRDALRDLKLRDATGALVPVVVREQVLYESQRHHERTSPASVAGKYLIGGLLIAYVFFMAGVRGARSRPVEVAFRVEVALWAFVTGVLGVILLGAWLATQHAFWYGNENLLLTNPLSLFLAVLAPLSLWRPRFARAAAIVAVVVAMAAAVALLLKGIPGSQRNIELIALLLPAHFAIAYQLWRRAIAGSPAPSVRPG